MADRCRLLLIWIFIAMTLLVQQRIETATPSPTTTATATTTRNPCYSSPCYRGTCYARGNYDYQCNCPYGFTGRNCQYYSTTSTQSSSTTWWTYSTRHLCHPNPCYGGTCYDVGNYDYRCNCYNGYEGKNCDYTTKTSPTTPTTALTPETPTTTNPCSYRNPCYRGTCYPVGNYDYICNCYYGYEGKNCDYITTTTTTTPTTTTTETPTTTSPCSYQTPCYRGTCYSVGNYDYICNCDYGFEGKNCDYITTTTTTTTTPTTNPCSYPNPCYRGTCYPVGNYDYRCNCDGGYVGKNCDYTPPPSTPPPTSPPVHTDYCATARCHHHGTCINTVSNFLCKCRPGFSGHRCQNVDACSGNPCKNGGTCKAGITGFICDCQAGYTGHNCDVVNGCVATVKNCRQMQCPVSDSAQCIECHDGFDLVSGACVECPSIVPILHCEKEARAGCLFRHCEQCETGFFPLGSGCDVCPDVDIGCREVNCTSYTDAHCTSCHPGYYPVGDTCAECPAPISNCGKVECSNNMNARCLTCRDGYIFYKDTCVLCPSQEVIPDCLDVGRAGCFDKWCRKCASGFYLRGTVCDVCPNLDIGCEHAQCNSTHDAHCVQCYHGYGLQNGICVRSHNGSPTPSSDVCTDSPNTDCSYLHSTIRLCDDTTRACQYCPRYCGMCDTCKHVQSIPFIG